jgi:hypothetical protein
MPKKTMTFRKVFLVVFMSGLLTACLGGIIANAGAQVLLAILKPMVGLDPNSNGLFQQPVIKDRMQAFLGDKYEPVMQLLMTANKLQEEGPLFYVVSRYTPVPQLAEKAGFVWNSETNQMAVMLITGGSPTVIAERVLVKQANQKMAEAVPQWPAEFQTVLDQDALKKKAAEAAAAAAANATANALGVDPALQQPLQQAIQGQPAAKTAAQIADEQAKKMAEEQLDAELKAQEAAGQR